jgi:hypothetical protein
MTGTLRLPLECLSISFSRAGSATTFTYSNAIFRFA